MELSKGLAKMVEQMSGLEEKAKKLESRCTSLEGLNQLLVEELEKARMQNLELEKARMQNLELVKNFTRKFKELEARGRDDKKPLGNSSGVVEKEEKLGPLDVFSKEVCEMFLHQLSMKDMKVCYQAHPDFRNVLKRYRSRFLFPDVVKVLAANVKGFGVKYPYYDHGSGLFHKLNPLLQCRLVCREWKEGVDRFLQQESPSFTSLPEANFVVPAFQFEYQGIDYGNLTSLHPNRNPMPSCFLLYADNYAEATTTHLKAEFEEAFGIFLKKYGGHVSTLKVKLSQQTDAGIAAGYNLLIRNLPKMPNLKELYLCNPLASWWNTNSDPEDGTVIYDEDDQIEDLFDPQKQLDSLFREVSGKPFPCLPALQRITFEDCPPFLIHSVLKANPHVKQLKVLQDKENETVYDLGDLDFPKLTEAHLDYYHEYLGDPSYWPLTKLTLDAPAILNWHYLRYFGLESTLQDSLEELDLRLYGPCMNPEDGRLILPVLKTLRLQLSRCFCSIDFILPLINLENLEVDFFNMSKTAGDGDTLIPGYKPVEDIVQVIKIHGYIDKLQQSNVWQLLPKLKQVRARTDWNEKVAGMYPEVNPKWHCCTRSDLI